MNIKALFAAGFLTASAVALAATSASAALVVNSVVPSTLNVSGPSTGTIDGLDVNNSNTYDWTFDIAGNPAGGLSQLQASFVANMASTSEPIAFSLYSGAPGSGTLIDSSSVGLGPSIFDTPLAAGNYFIQLDPANIAQNGEEVSGSMQLFPVSATPEPASWALMLLGVGAIGAAMRFSRRAATGLAVA
jgi:hypothetical protein